MTSEEYKEFLPKRGGKGKKKAGPSSDAEVLKRRRFGVVLGGPPHGDEVTITGSSSPSSTLATPPPPPPPPSAQRTLITMEPGELWKVGVTDRLRAVLKPPPDLIGGSGVNPAVRQQLAEMEEASLKMTSMIQTFQDLCQNYDIACASVLSLTKQVEELNKLKSDLEVKVQDSATELETAKKNLESVMTKVELATATENELVTQKESLEKTIADRDSELKDLQARFDRARSAVATAATSAFNNAIAQARVLNPGLITDGMDVAYGVKDGVIDPGSPVPEDSEEEEEVEGEDVPPENADLSQQAV